MEKIKQFFEETITSEKGKDVMIVMIVILVGLGSFELGRLSMGKENSGIKVLYPSQQEPLQDTNQQANVVSTSTSTDNLTRVSTAGKNFFASSRGSKYYSLGCSAGKSIKMENRVYFNTREDAEHAGYELSSSCK